MKNFNEWFANNTNSFYYNDSWIYGKAVWKATLEWVLKNLEKIYDGDFSNSDIVMCIEKELKDE